MKFYITKQLNNTLKASHGSDYEKLKKLKAGEEYQCEIKKPRNIKFHRMFFALVNMVFENQDNYLSVEDLRHDLTIEAGFYEEITNMFTGEVYRRPKSISFAKMDELEFSEFFTKFVNIVSVLVGVDNETIHENIQSFY